MPSSKDRLYVALHARSGPPRMPGGEDKYHWSLIVGPKTESPSAIGTRYHAKETMKNVDGAIKNVWVFEERQMSLLPTSAILVRIMIGKVTDKTRLQEAFAKTPIRAGLEGYSNWNCVFWLEEALSRGAQDGKALGKCHTDWTYVKDTAMWYVAKKAADHRFDGDGNFDNSKVPTWDILEGKEVIA
ncbi:uncharacterized protein RSE6_05884 [Rhynchosporium secalis]|uniref:Uncharacterized protein n=1 Tax=Rhynchosporium secalis TaxID=38038 RepID=A0A1E1M8Y4_RHYSE|nr:uncharacterized protein RSE6_05884 [Rhynchosporium secalis]